MKTLLLSLTLILIITLTLISGCYTPKPRIITSQEIIYIHDYKQVNGDIFYNIPIMGSELLKAQYMPDTIKERIISTQLYYIDKETEIKHKSYGQGILDIHLLPTEYKLILKADLNKDTED